MSPAGERPAELRDVQGAWQREGRRLDGGPWGEVAHVLWLQVGPYFCDLRTLLPGTPASGHMLDQIQAFAGTVAVSGGNISFAHDLDSLSRDPAHPDVSTVHRIGDAMYERGPGFEERWVLCSLPNDRVGVAELRDEDVLLARIVRVGELALAVWAGAAPGGGAQYSARTSWERERVIGKAAPHDVDDAVIAVVYGDTLPSGWTRTEKDG